MAEERKEVAMKSDAKELVLPPKVRIDEARRKARFYSELLAGTEFEGELAALEAKLYLQKISPPQKKRLVLESSVTRPHPNAYELAKMVDSGAGPADIYEKFGVNHKSLIYQTGRLVDEKMAIGSCNSSYPIVEFRNQIMLMLFAGYNDIDIAKRVLAIRGGRGFEPFEISVQYVNSLRNFIRRDILQLRTCTAVEYVTWIRGLMKINKEDRLRAFMRHAMDMERCRISILREIDKRNENDPKMKVAWAALSSHFDNYKDFNDI